MTVDRLVRLFAGLIIVLSVALSHFVHPYWLILTLFVGANLAQSGMTDICPLASLLKKLGVPAAAA